MKHITLPFVVLMMCLTVLLPQKTAAAYYISAKQASFNKLSNTADYPNAWKLHVYNHAHGFRGRSHGFWNALGLICSILGSVAVISALASAIFAAPTTLFIAGAYIFSILGIILGFTSHSETNGYYAVVIGLANLLVLWLGAAVYDAVMGNFTPLARLTVLFFKPWSAYNKCFSQNWFFHFL